MNPARSGDKQEICWMTENHEDFYFEKYRSIEGQFRIYELALELDAGGARQSAAMKSNQWGRNLSLYLSNTQYYAY